jgi:hypothetical protein
VCATMLLVGKKEHKQKKQGVLKATREVCVRFREPASVCRATDLPWLHAAVAPVAAPGGATLLVSVALREKLDAARPAHVRGT